MIDERDEALLALMKKAHQRREEPRVPPDFAANTLRKLRNMDPEESDFSWALFRALPGALAVAIIAIFLGIQDGSPFAIDEQEILVQSAAAVFFMDTF